MSNLALDFDHQLAIAKELLALAYEICEGTLHAETEFTRKDYIFFALADKNFATFEAIQALCERSLLDDAFALVRVLTECTINAAYVEYVTADVADDYANYSDFRNWVEYEGLREVAPELVAQVPATEVEEMQRKYAAVRERYERNRNRDWCSDSLFERASKIDKAIGGEFNLLRILVNSPWRKARAYVHGTASSITSRVREEAEGIVIRRRFTKEEAAAALFAANMVMFALLMFVDLRLGKRNAEKWRALYDRWCAPQSVSG